MQNKKKQYRILYSSFGIKVDLSTLAQLPEIKELMNFTTTCDEFRTYTDAIKQVLQKELDCDVFVSLVNYEVVNVEISDGDLISKAKECTYKTIDMFPAFIKEFKSGCLMSDDKVEFLEKLVSLAFQKEVLEDSLNTKEINTKPSKRIKL